MGLKARTFEFFNRWVPILTGNATAGVDVYLYGINNRLPNDNLRLINDSGIAKRATGKLKQYIESDGFSDKAAAEFKVNKDQTADQLLSEIASYAAYNKGFALTIQRDASGKIIEVRSIAFECIRVRYDGNYTYNPLLGQEKFKETDTKVHPKFFGLNPTPDQLALIAMPKKIDAKKKEVPNEFYLNLEILYVFEKTADNPNYPVPDYVAGIEDIKTSIELQGLDLDTVRNGFMTSAILVVPEMDGVNKDEAGKTEEEYFDDALKAMTGNVKDRDGGTRRNAITVIQVKSMEEAPKFMPWDSKVLVEASINKRDQIERTVARWIGVHPVLLGYSDAAILGNTQSIANASKEVVNNVNPIQRMISSALKQVFPVMDFGITQFNFWNIIPSEVWATLTVDEKRNQAGFAPLESKTSDAANKTIDAINSLSPLVANEVLKSLSEDEIRSLIGLAPRVVEPITTTEPIIETTPVTIPTNGVTH